MTTSIKANKGFATLLLISIAFLIEDASTANILAISPYFVKSHFDLMQPILLELTNRGHNVTVISPVKHKKVPPNYRHVEIDQINMIDLFAPDSRNSFEIFKPMPTLTNIYFIPQMLTNYADSVMVSKKLNDFILNDELQFDLVICEDFRFSPLFMFAHKYQAPLITLITFGGAHWVEDYMGNSMNLQYVPNEFLSYAGSLSFTQRLMNVLYTFFDILVKKLYFDPLQNQLAEKYFGHLPKPLPSVQELERNISLVFLNTHFSMDTVRSELPNMVEIGGIHIKPVKKLPEDLQVILDNAKDGVIYFNMGSNLAIRDIPVAKRQAFMKVFSELKQTILMKWEEDALPGQPKNVVIRKWFPQSDILAHPNVRLFITHGGILSVQEAAFRGVPIVGIPIYGDQPRNVETAKVIGYAEDLPFKTISENTVRTVLTKVLSDSSYYKRAKQISARLTDKPRTALETAIYWVEYVIRHNGAHHLKPASVYMPWYENYLLDIISIFFLSTLIILYIEYKIFAFIFHCIIKKQQNKAKVSKSKKRN